MAKSKDPLKGQPPANSQEAFLDIFFAALKDGAEGHTSQLKVQVDPDGKGVRVVRVVILPEIMEHEWVRPLGSSDQ